jgi:hypothetical protein
VLITDTDFNSSVVTVDKLQIEAVLERATLMLLGTGLAGLGLMRRRKAA